jgi:hypothetical protein
MRFMSCCMVPSQSMYKARVCFLPIFLRPLCSLAGEVRLEEVCLAERIGQGASSTVYRVSCRSGMQSAQQPERLCLPKP